MRTASRILRKQNMFRLVAMLLSVVFVAGILMENPITAYAAKKTNKTLTLKAAKSLAVKNSTEYEDLEIQLDAKQVSLQQAVKAIALKQKNMSTFRWSPVLNFSFPTNPDLAESYEFTYKPISIQAEIDNIKHQMTDKKLAIYEEVNNLFVDLVVYENTISFNKERLEVMEESLTKNKAKLLIGEAKQEDIDSIESAITAINDRITSNTRSYESAKKKMTTLTGIDVTNGYTFQNPLVEAELSRSKLSSITTYTLDHDQTYYEACVDADLAYLTLDTDYSLMKNHYSNTEMNLISNYVTAAKNGVSFSKKAFKSAYDNFLKVIDDKWNGKKKILFIRVPRLWFKGALDGVRYIEDEPYALYEAALEYQEARIAKQAAKETLVQSVEDTYNTYISVRNSYRSLLKQIDKSEAQLKADRILNKAGELTYEEYSSEMDSFESLQNDMFDALALYAQTMYSFDRLTCGAITKYLEGESVDINNADGGDSYVDEVYAEGAHYFIQPIVQNEEFLLTVNIPEEFEISITDFELWVDGIQIGSRTSVESSLRHLSLTKSAISSMKLRFYDDGKFIDDVAIDPDVYSGELKIVSQYVPSSVDGEKVGSYELSVSETTGMVKIGITPTNSNIAYFRILSSDGKALSTGDPVAVTGKFTYLGLIENSLSSLVIEYYDAEKKQIGTGSFNVGEGSIYQKAAE